MADTEQITDVEVLPPPDPRECRNAIPTTWDLFAAYIALGESNREAARQTGYAADYADRLMKNPEISERIRELSRCRRLDESSGIVSRIWIELQLVSLVRQNVASEKPDFDLARRTLMDVARLRGFIVERKASIHLQKQVGRDDLNQVLESYLSELAPNEAETLRKLSRGKGKIAKLAG